MHICGWDLSPRVACTDVLLNPALGLSAAAAIHGGVSVAALLMRRRTDWVRRIGFGGAAVASALTGLASAAALRSGGVSRGVLFVHHASGFSLDYAIDPLAAWFLLVLSALTLPIAIFSIGYGRHAPWDGRSVFLSIAFNVLVLSVELVFVAADVIGFLFGRP